MDKKFEDDLRSKTRQIGVSMQDAYRKKAAAFQSKMKKIQSFHKWLIKKTSK